MLKNFIKITLRHIQKHKLYTAINITGLVIAFTCSLLIFLYIKNELSYDRYHKNADNIYRVIQKQSGNIWLGTDLWNANSGMLKPALMEHLPEVVNATTICPVNNDAHIIYEEKHYMDHQFYAVEPEFLEIFSFPLVKGNPKTALSQPKSLLLTESMAHKYFGETDPVDKTLKVNDIEHTITGVLKDIPKNSHFTFDFLASFIDLDAKTWNTHNQGGPSLWNSNNFCTYIQIKDGIDTEVLGEKITQIVRDLTDQENPNSFQLQKLTDIHLHSRVNRELETNGNILYVYIFSGIAILLLLIASFNYMNLTTAQLLSFAKEAGVRKISGATQNQISFQFIGEAILFTLVASIISFVLIKFLIPAFGNFAERELTYKMLLTLKFIGYYLLIVIGVALLSGSYPAMILAKQHPVKVLKNNKVAGSRTIGVRNTLIVFQFVISITLVICSVVLFKQLKYLQNKELGYQKENIVIIPIRNEDLRYKYDVFKNELMKHHGILDVTYTQETLEYVGWGGGGHWDGQSQDEHVQFYHLIVDHNFLDFYNIELLEGQSYSKDMKVNGRYSYVLLNKKAVEAIGCDDPIGKNFRLQWSMSKVIGVVNDFNYQSLHLGIEPLAITLGDPSRHAYNVTIKVTSNDLPGILNYCENIFNNIFPGYDFSYSCLDDLLNNSYRTVQKLGKIFSIFTVIAIFVAIMGLFGLASFLAKQRTKEIGIRKVNGAKETEVIAMLNIDFMKWVIIAFIFAVPIAWFSMNEWIESFAYKTEINGWIFVLAGVITTFAALMAVSWQSWKAAVRNPVEALRYE